MPIPPRVLGPRTFLAVKTGVWVAALVPFARLVARTVEGDLGPNPVETVQRTTGWWALAMLCIALSITPARKLLGWTWLARLRRVLGLFAFFYASMHITTWLWLDHRLDAAELIADVVKRPFITVGFLAYVLLIPLAATSTNSMAKRLGGKRWQALHRTVYAIAPLAVLHFWWHKAGKNDLAEPAVFGLIVATLLGTRLWLARAASIRQPAGSTRSSA